MNMRGDRRRYADKLCKRGCGQKAVNTDMTNVGDKLKKRTFCTDPI